MPETNTTATIPTTPTEAEATGSAPKVAAPASPAAAPRVRRIFKIGDQVVADPNRGMTPQEVKAHLAANGYPQLTNASVTLIDTKENPDGSKTETWQLKTSTGTKG